MKFELVWHGPVKDTLFRVEDDSKEEAMKRLQLYLNDPDEVGGVEEVQDDARPVRR